MTSSHATLLDDTLGHESGTNYVFSFLWGHCQFFRRLLTTHCLDCCIPTDKHKLQWVDPNYRRNADFKCIFKMSTVRTRIWCFLLIFKIRSLASHRQYGWLSLYDHCGSDKNPKSAHLQVPFKKPNEFKLSFGSLLRILYVLKEVK